MSVERRTIFALGARLGMSAAAVEGLSTREVLGWVEFFTEQQAANAPEEEGVPVSSLSREQLRAMFPHG